MSQQHPASKEAKAKIIYIGIDAHVEKWVVVRQIDGLTPQPAQCFRKESTLLSWVGKQQKQAVQVVCCYEAGPTGFVLCRALRKMGVICHVVAPKRWAENEERVKTDKRDARILCQRLESYHQGNHSVLNAVRVPSEAEEYDRAMGRQREALKKEVKRNGQRGRGQALLYGVRLKGRWWSEVRFGHLVREHGKLAGLLAPLRAVIMVIEKELERMTRQLEEDSVAKGKRPKGLGALTWRIIKGEICDFSRFKNRRQMASYTGLCPSETSSGRTRRQGFVNKHGNPLLRQYLVEAVWRMIKWQSEWHAWIKWKEDFGRASAGRRKQIVVALARVLAIDLWRCYTGRTTLENLGLCPA